MSYSNIVRNTSNEGDISEFHRNNSFNEWQSGKQTNRYTHESKQPQKVQTDSHGFSYAPILTSNRYSGLEDLYENKMI